MENKKKIVNKILYRATHRGTKEMDILLGNFVKKYINKLSDSELEDLNNILHIEDKILYQWYFEKINSETIPDNKISKMIKKFKF